jgi:hypothetical protein
MESSMRDYCAVARFLLFLCALDGSGLRISARAQDGAAGQGTGLGSPVGKVISVTGVATIERSSPVVVQANLPSRVGQASAGDYVYKNDAIQTGPNSKISIIFTDGTAFNVSSEARMVLNEFVYDPNGSSNSALVSLISGTFTFVAGKVAKTGAMKIDTPVATMGIRGTTPHVEILSDGTVKYYTLIEEQKGTVNVTPRPPVQNKPLRPMRRAKAPTAPSDSSSEQKSAYNKLLNFDFRICRGC